MTPVPRPDLYRLKALEAEQRAKEAPDPEIRRQWSDLAIEWHAMAYFAGTSPRRSLDGS